MNSRWNLQVSIGYVLFLLLFSIAAWSNNPAEQKYDSLVGVKEAFSNPPAAFRPAPLWVWNDDMQEEEIARQLDEFKKEGFGGVFVHPRPGLITPYLSERWLKLWRFTAEECEKRGLVSYIYDENSYPSGFAGGIVPEKMPNVEQLSLQQKAYTSDKLADLKIDSDTIGLYKKTADRDKSYVRIEIPKLSAGEVKTAADLKLEPGEYIAYRIQRSGKSSWYGNRTYVDLMNPAVTEEFLKVTLGGYDTVLSDLYGQSVLACFTDEPQVQGSWSNFVPEAFQKQWGYDILDVLPSIHSEVGDWRKVRHDYAATVLELFMNNFAKPYYEACEKRGIAFTGHVWEHGWPDLSHNPDIMSFYAWQHWPGIDCLMNQYSEGPNAQFGNYRSNKELSSIANQLDKPRTLCETYGAGGWDLTVDDMYKIGDFLYAGGINLINPHLSYYTLRGARKRDHPQSFSYHAPYWEAMNTVHDYFGRLSVALSAGKEINPILVIQPTTSAWMYNYSPSSREHLDRLGVDFQAYITDLGSSLVEFDLGSEPVMAEQGSVKGSKLAVGKREYSCVILPPGLENLESSTVQLLETYLANGGSVVSAVDAPAYVDCRPSDAVKALQQKYAKQWVASPSFEEIKERWCDSPINLTVDSKQRGRVYLYKRQVQDGCIVFLANVSREQTAQIAVNTNGYTLERLDALDNKTQVEQLPDNLLTLQPGTSVLYAVHTGEKPLNIPAPQKTDKGQSVAVKPAGDWQIKQLEPNMLPLDYVDLVLKGETAEGLYFYDAQTRIYNAYGFQRNPWDNGVQYMDELIRQDRFPADSGFEMRYPFAIQKFEAMPSLQLVVERGDRYTVSVNGHTLQAKPGEWWLDRFFNVYEVKPEFLQNGKNVVSTVAQPFSIHHEPEPVYLLGDFCLESAERGWEIVPSYPLQLGPWSKQGRPFYSGKVEYKITFKANEVGQNICFDLKLKSWGGSVAKVAVNDVETGYAYSSIKPFELKGFHEGDNTVAVTVIGTLKNLLGPHHNGPVRGSAWPGMFQKAPKQQPAGDRYDAIEYGLMEPFVVEAGIISNSESSNR